MKSPFRLSISLLLVLFVSAACGNVVASPTETPTMAPTNTPLPTSTSTPKPTQTPVPTATDVPPTPTFVPVGVASISDEYEVTVVSASYFRQISSEGFIYTPTEGQGKFLDVGVVVRNLTGEPIQVDWENVYIIDMNKDGWYPNFGGYFAATDDRAFDATTLYLYPYSNLEYTMDDMVVGEYPLYLRAVWATDGARPATYLFGFDTSNLIEIVIP